MVLTKSDKAIQRKYFAASPEQTYQQLRQTLLINQKVVNLKVAEKIKSASPNVTTSFQLQKFKT